MKEPNDRFPSSSVSISMLISESVYRLVVVVERLLRWIARITRPHRFLLRIVLG